GGKYLKETLSFNSNEDTNKDIKYVYLNLGFNYLKMGEYENALQYYKLILNDFKEISDILDINVNASICLSELKRFEESIEFLLKALDIDSECVNPMFLLAYNYFNLKKYNDAIFWTKKVEKINPDYPDLKELIKSLKKQVNVLRVVNKKN
ncbi:MAG: tetratricopeptide repeat protein, partial [Nanoarchaeales archaeon]|nr:tetratricopeptide repeat protein [Nanoarchaeales archaeon]